MVLTEWRHAKHSSNEKDNLLHSFLVVTIEYFSQVLNWFLVLKTIYELCHKFSVVSSWETGVSSREMRILSREKRDTTASNLHLTGAVGSSSSQLQSHEQQNFLTMTPILWLKLPGVERRSLAKRVPQRSLMILRYFSKSKFMSQWHNDNLSGVLELHNQLLQAVDARLTGTAYNIPWIVPRTNLLWKTGRLLHVLYLQEAYIHCGKSAAVAEKGSTKYNKYDRNFKTMTNLKNVLNCRTLSNRATNKTLIGNLW